MRELYKKFNKVYDLVNKQFTSGASAETASAKKKPALPKKAKAAAKKGAKKGDKENRNPTTQVKSEKSDDEENEPDITGNNLNDDGEDEDDIRASAQDQSKMADFTTIENPLLESTTNVAKRGAAPKAKKIVPSKFEYTHRVSYTCLQKLLDIYFG